MKKKSPCIFSLYLTIISCHHTMVKLSLGQTRSCPHPLGVEPYDWSPRVATPFTEPPMGCFLLLSILENITRNRTALLYWSFGQHLTQCSRGIFEIISIRNSFTSSCTGHFIQVPLCILNKIFTVTLPLILNSNITEYTRVGRRFDPAVGL